MEFTWKGELIETVGDLLTAMLRCESKDEAQQFKTEYTNTYGSAKAESDLGFMTGEMSDEDRHRSYDWFDVSHPVLGNGDPTDEEIYDAGARMMYGKHHGN